MFLWPIIQGCILLLMILFVISQIIMPAITNKQLFWFFKKPESELLNAQRELSNLNVIEEVEKVKDCIAEKTENMKRSKK